MVIRRAFHLLGIVLTFLLVLGCTTQAQQPLKPVLTTTSLDGQLIGLETDLQVGIWKPIAALAYGLDSGRFRYKAGLMLRAGFDLPVGGQRLGDFRLALVDWLQSPILGREGQSGIELGWSLGHTQFSLFMGTLWTKEGEAPSVQYLSMDTADAWQLPFDLTLSSSSQMVIGMLLGDSEDRLFQSMIRTATLSLGDLRLIGRWGTLENEAQLEGFEFTTGVRGIAEALKGREFWNVTLERTFSLFETDWELPVPPDLAMHLPEAYQSLPVQLKGSFFVQAGGAKPDKIEGESESKMNMLFSWGMSAILSVSQLSLRAELIITQEGETKFHFGF